MVLEPEKFLEVYREIVCRYRGYKVNPSYLSTDLKGLPPELCSRSEIGFIHHSEELSLGPSKRGIEDRITAESGYIQRVTVDPNQRIRQQSITNIAILIYSDLNNYKNKYATVLFDLDNRIISRVQLNKNGEKMIPEMREIEGNKLGEGLESFFKIIYNYRNTQKPPYHERFRGQKGGRRGRKPRKLCRQRPKLANQPI